MKNISFYLLTIILLSVIACSKKKDQSFNAGAEFYDAFKKAIEKSIEDEDKQKKAIQVLDEFRDEILAFDEYLDGFAVEYQDILLIYHTTEEELLQVSESLNEHRDVTLEELTTYHENIVNERNVLQREVIEARLKVVSLMTKEEWNAVNEPRRVD